MKRGRSWKWERHVRALALTGGLDDDGLVHAWRVDKLRALWAVLPWRDGRITWSFDCVARALVVAWGSPRRRGQIKLAEAVIDGA